MLLLLTIALFAAQLHAVIIPGPSGPYSVSYASYDLTDESRDNPYAHLVNTTDKKRRIVVSSYIPVEESVNCTLTELPYMPPQSTVEYGQYAASNGLPDTLFEDIELEFCQLSSCSKGSEKKYPLVLFSHGLSSSRLLHNVQARTLASYGFVVVTVDHPYHGNQQVRAQDLSFVLDLVERSIPSPGLPDGLVQKVDLSRVFAYGHSLGGATALEAALLDDRVLGAFDIDGSPWAQAKQNGLGKPLYEKLTGPKMQIRVEGATHYSYIDIPVLLAARPLPPQYDPLLVYLIGTVDGLRMEKIVLDLLLAFGELVFESDKQPLLSASTYSEIFVVEEDL